MNNFSYENQGTNTYLIYQIAPNDEMDTLSMGMITNNEIPGLAEASFTQMDTAKYIKFNVSAKISVSQLFSGPVNKKRLLGVFTGVVDAMLAAEDYMLDPNNLLLDLDYIFADVSTCETLMVCLPIMNMGHKNPDLGMFFKNIIFNTQFDQTENCDHVAQILNYLNSNPVISLTEFKELLEGIDRSGPAPAPQPRPQPVPQPAPRAVQQPVAQTKPVQQPVVKQAPIQPAKTVQQVPQQPKVQPEKKYTDLQFGNKYPQPGQNTNAYKAPDAQAQTASGEKPMSMFYLLQHYNKENAAKYKAQQEAQKNSGGKQAKQSKQAKQNPPAVPQGNGGFAIPGQQSAVDRGFAIPGQQPASNAAFTAPAQQAAMKPAQPAAKPVQQPVRQAAAPSAGGDTCAKCGKPLAAGQMFCTSCGTRRAAAAPAQQPVVSRPVQQPVVPKPAQQPVSGAINFGETTVLGGAGIGETTVLGTAAEPNRVDPHLIRTKNNERIPLNKPVFRIGKERSYVDYFIGDNTAISRSHANIINRNGEFFVVDTNSTNHTYVNGGMIQSNTETRLEHGTKICFANEDFEFRMF